MLHEQDEPLNLPPRLVEGIRQFDDRPPPMDSNFDAAILADAAAQLSAVRRRRAVLYRIGPAVAAAAVLALGVWVTSPSNDRPGTAPTPPLAAAPPPVAPPPVALSPADIDASGRVDILDAYKLAKLIDRMEDDNLAVDVTRDGAVDQRDVNLIAAQAVSLSGGALTPTPAGGAG